MDFKLYLFETRIKMFNAHYWNDRARKYNHTGHSEPFLYCFDQEARKFAIGQVLKNLISNKRNALDFGCGSGDFISLLLQEYETVCGVDISEVVLEKASERFKFPNVEFSVNLSSIEKTFDLILTVTVLQTFTENELNNCLSQFAQLLSPQGKMVAMEFFPTEEFNTKENQNRLTINQWNESLNKYQLKIDTITGFYNPVLFPSKSWQKYRSRFLLRLLKPLKQFKTIQNVFKQSAKKIINEHADVFPYPSSTFKIYVISKKDIE